MSDGKSEDDERTGYKGSDLFSNEMTLTPLLPNTVYVCVLMFNIDKQLLMLPSGALPMFAIVEDLDYVENFSVQSKDFLWAKHRSMDWEKSAYEAVNLGAPEDFVFQADTLSKQASQLSALLRSRNSNRHSAEIMSTKFKTGFFCASAAVQRSLGCSKFGYTYPHVISLAPVPNTKLIVSVQFSSHAIPTTVLQNYPLKWRSPRYLHPQYHSLKDDSIWATYLQFYQSQKITLKPGIYIGMFSIRNTLQSMDILVPRHHPDLIPLQRVHRREVRRVNPNSADNFGLPSPVSPMSTSAHTSMISKYTDQSDASLPLYLSEIEWEYLKILATPTKAMVSNFRQRFEINPSLEQFGKDCLQTIDGLRRGMGLDGEVDITRLSPLGPVVLDGGVTILILDLQTHELVSTASTVSTSPLPENSSPFKSFFGRNKQKLEVQEVAPPPEHPATQSLVDERLFSFISLSLFEALHHHSFNNGAFTAYRQIVEPLQSKKTELTLTITDNQNDNDSTNRITQMQSCMDEVYRLRKQWNLEFSWSIKLLQAQRKKVTTNMNVF